MPSQTTLALVGAALSAYAIYVEYRHGHEGEGDEPFVAICDIDYIGASCSSVLALPEGRLLSYFGIVPDGSFLDVPNACLGLIYYCFILLLGSSPVLNLVAACAAMSASLYLASVLTTLKELCVLCWTTHVINLWLLAKFVVQVKQKDASSTKAKSS